MFIAVGLFCSWLRLSWLRLFWFLDIGFPDFHAEFVNFIFRMSFFGHFSCVFRVFEFSHEFFYCLFMRFSLFWNFTWVFCRFFHAFFSFLKFRTNLSGILSCVFIISEIPHEFSRRFIMRFHHFWNSAWFTALTSRQQAKLQLLTSKPA